MEEASHSIQGTTANTSDLALVISVQNCRVIQQLQYIKG